MASVNLNMGNLNLEVSSLKNKLAIEEKEKAILQVELDKEKNFQREYKHNIKIQRKNKTKNMQKIKALIQNENQELKTKTTMMKSQDEKLKELMKMAKNQETAKKKWAKTLFHYRQQQEALGSQVEALTKEKKEKENVLINSKLVNLKSASLLNYEEIRKVVEVEKVVEANKAYQRNLQQLQAQLETTNEQKKSLDLVSVKKWLEDHEQMLQYYTLMRPRIR